MTKLRIKTGDIVKVNTGKDKGKTGKVIQTFPALNRVVVEGVNVSKRHLRSRKTGEKGQTVEFSMPIHASNVQPVTDGGAVIRHDDKPDRKAGATNA
jgi:large subunit ribosomal protein L24